MARRIVVAGLGPAGADLLNRLTLDAVDAAVHVRLRTGVHPAAAAVRGETYDHLYESLGSFEEVYEAIVADLIELSATGEVVYLVPGAPTVAERTVELLVAAHDRGAVEVALLPALSFLDLAWSRLRIDPVEMGVTIADAHLFDPVKTGGGSILIGQCHDAATMSDVKLAYDDPEPARATILHHLGLEDELIVEVDWADIDRTVDPDHLTSLFIADAPVVGIGPALERFDSLVRRLRADCPWDKEQDHVSLVPHLIEEAYEVVEVIDAAAMAGGPSEIESDLLCEELGDLLFQVFLHSVIASERFDFDMVDVANGIHDKLYARHPHVFGDVEVENLDELAERWETGKRAEKGRQGTLDGLPALPSLPLASKVVRKVRRAGFAWDDISGAWSKVEEELGELREATETEDASHQLRELGDVLLAVVGLANDLGLDPDAALRHAVDRFRVRFESLEAHFESQQVSLADASLSDKLAVWRSVR